MCTWWYEKMFPKVCRGHNSNFVLQSARALWLVLKHLFRSKIGSKCQVTLPPPSKTVPNSPNWHYGSKVGTNVMPKIVTWSDPPPSNLRASSADCIYPYSREIYVDSTHKNSLTTLTLFLLSKPVFDPVRDFFSCAPWRRRSSTVLMSCTVERGATTNQK